ncbi:LysR substrate-binding domain-containing protein [Pinisolibacter aquiterrae]|uniref:LysR substrate-binding domain-containing protein n=1 Tax=Pinisolibacter aquiterrae TaxID=2815579 RepID=UPI001C3E22DB|nr:LysR substrate-binding domain-containing protein [Pinisolibacter aquiterrae]MBV5265107.1 LysR family transcriptional regulator [Pinisolibacter aquiterrae]MCC8235563.1 LysR family transcriptional regulator [Pinisolibacter aquiterrae]
MTDVGSEQGASFTGAASLEIDLLKTFAAIARTGSFSRAAQAVFRTPSAVSMQMKRLEEIVGRPLFAKDGRTVVFTEAGDDLLGYARRILRLNEEALARFRCADTAGMVRLGTPDDYATKFLPKILARFAASHPLVQVDVVCRPSTELAQRLDEDQIDIALISSGLGCTLPTSGTIVHREKLVWAGVRYGEAHERRPLPLAVSGTTCSWRTRAMDVLDRLGVAYRVAYSSQHYVGQMAAVLADLAVAPLPSSVIDGELVPIDERVLPPIGHYEIQMIRSARAAGAAVDALAGHIVSSFEIEEGMLPEREAAE